ncbi:MAG: DUF5667 domain-containing protein [Aeromicrobium sp.]|uniref:DUF5667 domain-containing protein n=1 Tax=Aeromicrobium sp. TaxID=1871063 RepID=UPI0039E60C13
MATSKRDADAFEAALRGGPVDAAVRDVVRQAEALCEAAATVTPAASFRVALRERLMAEAADVLVVAERPAAAPVSTATPWRRRVARISAAAVIAVGGVGIVASSAQAVPGDLLYSVKRGVENIELALHRSDAARGEFQLAQARERLAEAEYLAAEGDFNRSADALADFRSQADAGASDLFAAYQNDSRSTSVESVNDFAAESASVLSGLVGRFPADGGTGPVELSIETIREIVTQAGQLCGECAVPTLPSLLTTAEIVTDADGTSASATPSAAPTATPSAHPTSTPQPSVSTPTPSSTPLPTAVPPVEVPVVTPLLSDLLGDDGVVPSLLGGL